MGDLARLPVPLEAVPPGAVVLDDAWAAPRLLANRAVTLPAVMERCEASGRVDNFARAAGRMAGDHAGRCYDDSDVFKTIEGASRVLAAGWDEALAVRLEDWIDRVAAAQEPDGYLYTVRTIAERTGRADRLRARGEGLSRWSSLRTSHELYNLGHLLEAAVAHHAATGGTTLLDVARRAVDLLARTFLSGGHPGVPGHPEIELALVALHRHTGDPRCLDLARHFLDARGREAGDDRGALGPTLEHRPVREQRDAVGHAVRAGYLYAGMADVAAAAADGTLGEALLALWDDVVGTKLYLTGGLGARADGEAFGAAWELPPETAYAETCAAIANVLWNQRLFRLQGEARFVDVLERSLWNGVLAGVSLAGDRFFYANPLASDGRTPFNAGSSAGRLPWFACACCPTNLVRFLPTVPGLVYAQRDDALYVNLFLASRARIAVGGVDLLVVQATAHPWNGAVAIALEPQRPVDLALRLRIPGWARGRPVPSDLYAYDGAPAPAWSLDVNGQVAHVEPEADGYVTLRRCWRAGDRVRLRLPMPVRRVVAHPAVAAVAGKVAFERGPLVYAFEGVDQGGTLDGVVAPPAGAVRAVLRPDLLGGTVALEAQGGARPLRAVPYARWGNRGAGAMAVWIPAS